MSIVHLSPVELAYVNEIAAHAAAAQKAIEQQANAKLEVVLAAHGLTDSNATFKYDGKQWTLVLPATAEVADDAPPINDQ
jgi:hypothetical protein